MQRYNNKEVLKIIKAIDVDIPFISYDEYREKQCFNRDIDLIVDRANANRFSAIIQKSLANIDLQLLYTIDNYYSVQLIFIDLKGGLVQIDLMDGVYKKHKQIISANYILGNSVSESPSLFVAVLKYIKSRVYQLKRFADPPGRKVVFLGVDGAGKSTIINELCTNLETSGFKMQQKYLFPGYFRRYSAANTGINSEPYRYPLKSHLDSIKYQLIWSIEFIAGEIRDLYLRYIGTTLIYDRFLYDMFLDPRRYSLRNTFIVRYLAKFIHVDLVVILVGDLDLIIKRKKEISREELKLNQENLMEFYLKYDQPKVYLDTTSTNIDDCINMIRDEIIKTHRPL